jgi:hypothetical protein
MLISRCAWHPFFRGYPRPLRVISWRGFPVRFSDTICRSCAERVRIEGLWASAPPAPVWPGSAQTAALFVGLPLLIALVLMAAPLHDPGPPPAFGPPAAAVVGERVAEAPAVVDQAPAQSFSARRAAVSRPRRQVDREPVPAVIYETRRELRRQPTGEARGSSAAAPRATVSWLSRELARQCNCVVTLTSAAERLDSRAAPRTESP